MLFASLSLLLLWGCNGGEGDDGPENGGDLPELFVSQARLQGGARVAWVYIEPEACSIEDDCAEASGWRRVVQFSTEIQNRGDGAVVLGPPAEDNELVTVDPCRGRPAVNVAPQQSLIDSAGEVVRSTRARPFCWADSVRLDDVDGSESPLHPISHQTCSQNQGISPGWASIQASNADCQLLDVTDLPEGEYTLRLTLDPDGRIQQKSRDGETAEATVWILPIDEHEVCIGEDDCHVPVIGACEGVSCPGGEEPVSFCEGDVAVTVEGPGICHPVEGTCVGAREETDCAALGQVCLDGRCSDGCEEIGCEHPDDYCDGNVAVAHEGPLCDLDAEECLEPEIVYVDCEEELMVCEDGACVDLCAEVDCSGVRTYCEGADLVIEGPGDCDWLTGECVGGEIEVIECDEGETCEDGECVPVEDDDDGDEDDED